LKKTGGRNRIVALFSFAFIIAMAVSQKTLEQDVRYNFDSSADFTTFKTYKWVDNPNRDKLIRPRRPAIQSRIGH